MVTLSLNCLVFYWIDIGLGKHITAIDPTHIPAVLKCFFALQFLFNVALILPKLSALFFYWRVFGLANKPFRWTSSATFALGVSWIISAIPTITWSCVPISKFWNREQHGHCINVYAWFLVSGAYDILIDLIVLLLPIPMVWNLQMARKRKVLVAGAFVCGYGYDWLDWGFSPTLMC